MADVSHCPTAILQMAHKKPGRLSRHMCSIATQKSLSLYLSLSLSRERKFH